MRLVLIWLVIAYSALKLGSIARAGGSGFRRADLGFRDRLRAREPGLLIVAILVSVPFALLAKCYVHRTLTSQYEHAVDCYGRMTAQRAFPAFRDYAGGFAVYERAEGHRQTALVMGGDLEMTPEAVKAALMRRTGLFADRYAALQNHGGRPAMQREIDRAHRCLAPPGAG